MVVSGGQGTGPPYLAANARWPDAEFHMLLVVVAPFRINSRLKLRRGDGSSPKLEVIAPSTIDAR